MDIFVLKALAGRVAAELLADLRVGRIPVIGGETIEVACDAAVHDLSADERETLLRLTCRRVVQLTASDALAPGKDQTRV